MQTVSSLRMGFLGRWGRIWRGPGTQGWWLVLLVGLGLAAAGHWGRWERPVARASSELPRVPVFAFPDSQGQVVASDDLAGHVWVVSFFHTRCGEPCDRVAQGLERIRGELANHPLVAELQLVSLGIDPVSDTLGALARQAEAVHADLEPRWRFLAADPPGLDPLSESLGVTLGEPIEGQLIGGEKLVLVDREGRIRGRWDGRSELEILDLLATLETLLEAPGTSPAPDTAVASLPRLDHPALADHHSRRERLRRDRRTARAQPGFSLVDRRVESGITFEHRPLPEDPDGTAEGNGLAVADVDGDGLHDLYFTTQRGRNQLWRNLGEGRFRDVTAAAGVGLGSQVSVAAAFGDVDNDGDPDLVVTRRRGGAVLLENDGGGHFETVTPFVGALGGGSGGATLFDFDRDGWLDLFLAGQGLLLRNLGGLHFEDVTVEQGLAELSGYDATPIDHDSDGWPDLYLALSHGADRLLRNASGRGFVDVTEGTLGRTPWGSTGAKVADFDADGGLDLLVTDAASDLGGLGASRVDGRHAAEQWNADAPVDSARVALASTGPVAFGSGLFRADSKGLRDVGPATLAPLYQPWGPSVGDLDADGWLDVVLPTGGAMAGEPGIDTVWLNRQGKGFATALDLITDAGDGPSPSLDLVVDCELVGSDDWRSEVCTAGLDRAVIEGYSSSRSAVVFDLDRDGDLDVTLGPWAGAPRILVSDLAQRQTVRRLEIWLEGTLSNRDGLGARVTVRSEGRSQVQSHDGRSGTLAQSSLPLYFGLGDGVGSPVIEVEVEWPSGQIQTVTGALDDGRWTLREPS